MYIRKPHLGKLLVLDLQAPYAVACGSGPLLRFSTGLARCLQFERLRVGCSAQSLQLPGDCGRHAHPVPRYGYRLRGPPGGRNILKDLHSVTPRFLSMKTLGYR